MCQNHASKEIKLCLGYLLLKFGWFTVLLVVITVVLVLDVNVVFAVVVAAVLLEMLFLAMMCFSSVFVPKAPVSVVKCVNQGFHQSSWQ